MPLPSQETLEALRAGEPPLELLAKLDADGLLLAPGESAGAFAERLSGVAKEMDGLESEIAKPEGYAVFPGVVLKNSERIPKGTLAEAEAETERLYSFKIDWVPGFFLSKGVGPLWGGCAISFPGGAPVVFLIRSAFAKAKRWFIYDREELMAHELCHVARTPLADRPLEERFAYQTAKSRLRRATGNCFQSQTDAFAFIIPVFILLGAQLLRVFAELALPIWPFWLFAFSGPACLFVRNFLQTRVALKALKALATAGCAKPEALLFRMLYAEAKELAASAAPEATLKKLGTKDLRLAVAFHRFMDEKEGTR